MVATETCQEGQETAALADGALPYHTEFCETSPQLLGQLCGTDVSGLFLQVEKQVGDWAPGMRTQTSQRAGLPLCPPACEYSPPPPPCTLASPHEHGSLEGPFRNLPFKNHLLRGPLQPGSMTRPRLLEQRGLGVSPASVPNLLEEVRA